MPAQEPNEFIRNQLAKAQAAYQQSVQRSSGKEQQRENSIDPESPEQSQLTSPIAYYAAFVRFQNDVGFLITDMIFDMRDKDDEIRRLQKRVEELEVALTQKGPSDGDRKSAGSVRFRPMLSSSRR